jgi:hypothetical protein
VRLETGEVLKIHHLAPDLFGEGIACYNDTIFQITWENHIGFAYVELDSFAPVDTFSYTYSGWGLTHDDTSLILSDGSNRLYYLDPRTFEETRRIEATADGVPVNRLNELEYVQGKIYANILGASYVAIIEPGTGEVVGWIDLGELHTPRGVHNGIAFDRGSSRLFVTGKRWENLYEIRVDPIDYPPEILHASPSPSVWIGADSTIVLTVHCHDPDPEDTLVYAWSVNGVIDPSAGDTSYAYTSPHATVDVVVATVSDGKFSDSTSWTVTVGVTELSQGYPNPFATEMTLRFALPRLDHVKLRIYDTAGRLVKTLVNTGVTAGIHEATWDGRDSSGKPVAPGLYFANLRTGTFEATRKTLKIR